MYLWFGKGDVRDTARTLRNIKGLVRKWKRGRQIHRAWRDLETATATLKQGLAPRVDSKDYVYVYLNPALDINTII